MRTDPKWGLLTPISNIEGNDMKQPEHAEMSLPELADKMAGIDIAVLTTRTADGALAGRPMSNNGDVKYNGESYFFTYEDAHTVEDIARDGNVGLAYQGSPKLFIGAKFYVFVEGKASLVRDKAAFREHWTPELDKWFEGGIDSPDIVMIKVKAEQIKFWDGMKHGSVKV
jgi:general stress protein 26